MRNSFILALLATSPLTGGELFGGLQRFDSEFEGLCSDDIDVWSAALSYEQERNGWRLNAGLTRLDYSLDYVPASGGLPTDLSESTLLGNLSIARELNSDFELSLGLRTYDGFANYRSLWIAEYYGQDFQFNGSGYSPPSPGGWSLTGGAVWNPRVESRVNFSLTYGEDRIAPGWSTPFESSNDLLKSRSTSIRWEETLSPKLKTETLFTYSDITDRDPRVLLQSSWNYAFNDDFTLRLHTGAVKENPNFESIYGGISLDYQVSTNWSLALSTRLYHDSGEIENSGFNTAAPGLKSSEIGLSALYQKGEHSIRASVSYYDTHYDAVDADNEEFLNLFQDRNWVAMRLAYSLSF